MYFIIHVFRMAAQPAACDVRGNLTAFHLVYMTGLIFFVYGLMLIRDHQTMTTKRITVNNVLVCDKGKKMPKKHAAF